MEHSPATGRLYKGQRSHEFRINTHNHSLAGLVCVVTPCSSLSVRLSHPFVSGVWVEYAEVTRKGGLSAFWDYVKAHPELKIKVKT